MGKVLYVIPSEYDFASILEIPIFMLIVVLVFPIIIRIYCEIKDIEFNKKFIKIFFGLAACFVICSIALVGVGQFSLYNKTVGAYKKGEYKTVEGYVENFVPMPYEGHAHESFEINGVKFSYSDNSIQPAYNKTKPRGGVISGNGQHLKIHYVYYDLAYGNLILYIEQLP